MKRFIIAIVALATLCIAAKAQDNVPTPAPAPVTKIGIIGLDTSHSIAFTKYLNDPNSFEPQVLNYEVVIAYPYGTQTIESASKRIPKYIDEIQNYGVKIAGSIEQVISQADCIFIETNDGRMHLDQAIEVFKSGKKVYIDKPLGSTLGETIAIFKMAEKYGTSTFSSSSIRFAQQNQDLRAGVYGDVKGADIYSPHHPEPTHPDFGYYGIHGVEGLFTVMGPGCKEVSRVHSEQGDICTGVWEDGRLGTFRAITTGPNIYGGTAITSAKKAVPAGGNDGYKPLVNAILAFFETGTLPVSPDETIEIFTFMKASNMSLKQGGKPVKMSAALKAGQADANKIIKAIEKAEQPKK